MKRPLGAPRPISAQDRGNAIKCNPEANSPTGVMRLRDGSVFPLSIIITSQEIVEGNFKIKPDVEHPVAINFNGISLSAGFVKKIYVYRNGVTLLEIYEV